MAEQPAGSKAKAKVTPKSNPADALSAHLPWIPPTCTPEQLGALRALYAGTAMEHQQRMAFDYICEMSYNGGAHYFPGESGRRDTDFALGRAFVGQILKTLVRVKIHRESENG